MPVGKDALIRIKILDRLLSDRHQEYDMEDLQFLVNEHLTDIPSDSDKGCKAVSKRCIEKDIKYIESTFEAKIQREWIDGHHIIRYAEPDFSIFRKELTDDERTLLSEMLNTLGQFEGLDNFEWVEGIKNRLNLTEHRRIISFDQNKDLTNSKMLMSIFTMISKRVPIELKYKGNTKYIFHPWLLKQYNNRWFVVGWRDDASRIENPAVDRIVSWKEKPKIEYVEPFEDFEEAYSEVVGVTVIKENPIRKILLWISDATFPYIDTKPLHESMIKINIGTEKDKKLRLRYPKLTTGHFLYLKCRENYELLQLIFSHNKNIILLEPIDLQQKLKVIIESMTKNYSANIEFEQ